MNRLLEFVLQVHGGVAAWNRFSDMITNIEVGGQLCERKKLKRALPVSRLLLSLREQRVVMTLLGTQEQFLVQPAVVSSVGERGLEVDKLVDPKSTLLREGPDAPWDTMRMAYFVARSAWHNVTAPFLYTFPGFEVEEVEPWSEDGEIWKVLKVTFPPMLDAHSRVQYAYYGDEGLLRRQRYSIEILGGLDCVNYVTGYEPLNRIMVPTSREIFACDPNGHKIEAQPLAKMRLLEPFFSD